MSETAIEKVNGEMALTKPPEASLGSLLFSDPDALVKGAAKLATTLAKIIEEKNLYKMIGGKKYVVCEGWCTLGALIGIVPAEDWSKRLPNEEGYESRIKLIRTRDGMEIGGASAECTYDEQNWEHRDRYALKSMSQTRATGKAFRLSFSWMMVLAGYAPTPAEEVPKDGFEQRGSREAAQKVATEKIAGYQNGSAVPRANIPNTPINLPPVPASAAPQPKEDAHAELIHGIIKRIVDKKTTTGNNKGATYKEIGVLDQHDRSLTLYSFDNFQLSDGRFWSFLAPEIVGNLGTFVCQRSEKKGTVYLSVINVELLGTHRWEKGLAIVSNETHARGVGSSSGEYEPQVPL